MAEVLILVGLVMWLAACARGPVEAAFDEDIREWRERSEA